MRTIYYDENDILVLRLSDKPVFREMSQDWNTRISYAEDGTTVKIVLLDAKANGAYTLALEHAPAALSGPIPSRQSEKAH